MAACRHIVALLLALAQAARAAPATALRGSAAAAAQQEQESLNSSAAVGEVSVESEILDIGVATVPGDIGLAAVEAEASLNATLGAPPCEDANPTCPTWSARGECEKNPKYMAKNCRASCQACTPAAVEEPTPPAPATADPAAAAEPATTAKPTEEATTSAEPSGEETTPGHDPKDKIPVTHCYQNASNPCPDGETCVVKEDLTWSQCVDCSAVSFSRECQKLDDSLRFAAIQSCKRTCLDTRCYDAEWCPGPYKCVVDHAADWGQCISCQSKKFWEASCFALKPGMRARAQSTCHKKCGSR